MSGGMLQAMAYVYPGYDQVLHHPGADVLNPIVVLEKCAKMQGRGCLEATKLLTTLRASACSGRSTGHDICMADSTLTTRVSLHYY